MTTRDLHRRWHAGVVAVLAALVTAVLVGGAIALGAPSPGSGAERAPTATPTLEVSAALAAAEEFLDRYVEPDGRVVRRDQGGDTVSEGQAYAMLAAAAIGDRERFTAVWEWTSAHLQRPDGLLAWRWQDGEVVDEMPAADADVDAAHALSIAATRFSAPALADDARRLARAIVTHEVVEGRLGPVLVAGPWAVPDRWVNPSYGAPVAFDALADVTGDEVWRGLAAGARRVVGGSTDGSDLPPDWARLTDDAVVAEGAPAGGPVQHGYDAARVAIRMASDCDPSGPDLAAAMDDEYDAASEDRGAPPAVLTPEGASTDGPGHPVMSVAAAASSLAAGGKHDAARLLAVAETQDDEWPSYYGAAWIALGRLWLTTDRLGGCRAA